MSVHESIAYLAECFAKNGYVRSGPSAGSGTHRGFEARFTADHPAEVREIVRHLRRLHIAPGRPFPKGRKWRIPIYGRYPVQRLLDMLAPAFKGAAGLGR